MSDLLDTKQKLATPIEEYNDYQMPICIPGLDRKKGDLRLRIILYEPYDMVSIILGYPLAVDHCMKYESTKR